MEISGYDVQISDVGRIVTMIKNDEVYYFLVDSEYNINNLNNINNIGSGNNFQGNIKDYRENLLYQVDFNNLLNNTNEKVTINSTEGITVDSTNTYATFDGTGGIILDASLVDPEGKLLGTSSKTISLWYRTTYNNSMQPLNIRH